MTNVPWAQLLPGIYQVCTTANTDYVITVPDNAIGFVLWFETSDANSALVNGRVGISSSNTVITPIANTDNKLGYHPVVRVEYELPANRRRLAGVVPLYLHVANNLALAVARGYWVYGNESGT